MSSREGLGRNWKYLWYCPFQHCVDVSSDLGATVINPPVLQSASEVKIGAVVEIAIAQEFPQGMKWMLCNIVALSVIDIVRVKALSRIWVRIRAMCMVIVRTVETVWQGISISGAAVR